MPHLQHPAALSARHGLPPPPPLPGGAAAFASQLAKDLDRGLRIGSPAPEDSLSPEAASDDDMPIGLLVPQVAGVAEVCSTLEQPSVEAALASIFEHFGHLPGKGDTPEAPGGLQPLAGGDTGDDTPSNSVRSLSSRASSTEPVARAAVAAASHPVPREAEAVLEDPFQGIPAGGLSRRSHDIELRRVQQRNSQTLHTLRGRFTPADNRELNLLMQRAVEAVAWGAACDANPGLVQALEAHNDTCFNQEANEERKLSHLLASPSSKPSRPKKKVPPADIPKILPQASRLTRAQVLQQRWRGLSSSASTLRDKANEAERLERRRQLRTEIISSELTDMASGRAPRHHHKPAAAGAKPADAASRDGTGAERGEPSECAAAGPAPGVAVRGSGRATEPEEGAITAHARPLGGDDANTTSEAESQLMNGMQMDNAPRTNMDLLRWSRRASRTLDSLDRSVSSLKRDASPSAAGHAESSVSPKPRLTASTVTLESPMVHVGLGTVRTGGDQAPDPKQHGNIPLPGSSSGTWRSIDELIRRRVASEPPQDKGLSLRVRPYSQRARYGSSEGEEQQGDSKGSPGSSAQVTQHGPFAERPPAAPCGEMGGLNGGRRKSQLDKGAQAVQSPLGSRESKDGAFYSDSVPMSLLPNFPGLRFHSQPSLNASGTPGQGVGISRTIGRDATPLASARHRGHCSKRLSLDDARPLTARHGRRFQSETSVPGPEDFQYTVLMQGNEHFSEPAHFTAKPGDSRRVSRGAAEAESGLAHGQDDVTPGSSFRRSVPADHKSSGWASLTKGQTEVNSRNSADFPSKGQRLVDNKKRSASMRIPGGAHPAQDQGLHLVPQGRPSLTQASSSKRKKKRSSRQLPTSGPKAQEPSPTTAAAVAVERPADGGKSGSNQGPGKEADSVPPLPEPASSGRTAVTRMAPVRAPPAPTRAMQRQQQQQQQYQGGSFSYPNIDISTVLGSRGSESNRGLQRRMIDIIRYQSDSVKEERDKEGT